MQQFKSAGAEFVREANRMGFRGLASRKIFRPRPIELWKILLHEN